jgi:hypothetical protein
MKFIWLFGSGSIWPSRPAHGPIGPGHTPQPDPLPLILTLSSSPLPLFLSWRCARAHAAGRRPGRRRPRPPPATRRRGSRLVSSPVCPLPRRHPTLARAASQNPSRHGLGSPARFRASLSSSCFPVKSTPPSHAHVAFSSMAKTSSSSPCSIWLPRFPW